MVKGGGRWRDPTASRARLNAAGSCGCGGSFGGARGVGVGLGAMGSGQEGRGEGRGKRKDGPRSFHIRTPSGVHRRQSSGVVLEVRARRGPSLGWGGGRSISRAGQMGASMEQGMRTSEGRQLHGGWGQRGQQLTTKGGGGGAATAQVAGIGKAAAARRSTPERGGGRNNAAARTGIDRGKAAAAPGALDAYEWAAVYRQWMYTGRDRLEGGGIWSHGSSTGRRMTSVGGGEARLVVPATIHPPSRQLATFPRCAHPCIPQLPHSHTLTPLSHTLSLSLPPPPARLVLVVTRSWFLVTPCPPPICTPPNQVTAPPPFCSSPPCPHRPPQVDSGCDKELVFGDPTAPRFVYWEKKLRATPSGPDALTFDLLSIWGKIRAGLGAVGLLKDGPMPG